MKTIQVGNAPCSWGTLEFDNVAQNEIGYAQMLDELAAAGYSGTELGDWGFMPTDPAQLSAELAHRNLNMLGAFVGVKLKDPTCHADGEKTAVRTARLLADVAQQLDQTRQPFLVLADDNDTIPIRSENAGRITPDMSLSDEAWQTYAAGVNRIATAIKTETGLRTVFHHHCAGYVETPDEIATLLSLTDPDLVGLVFDTGHYLYGSGNSDPQTVLKGLDRFADRIWYIHFKDCHPQIAAQARSEGWNYLTAISRGVFCELGQGSVDFPTVLRWMREKTTQDWILVEQDVLPGMGAPKESAQRNRDYLHTIGI